VESLSKLGGSRLNSKNPQLSTVNVSDIVEYPTELGYRCGLLQKLGIDPYLDTEEKVYEALTESAKDPKNRAICLNYKRCRTFWNEFKQGRTPFVEDDPIRLVEFGGKYWVNEGKHRVCLAKRFGVPTLVAHVEHLEEDIYSLLPEEGKPGQFHISYSITCPTNHKKGQEYEGSVALLQVYVPKLKLFNKMWLDVTKDTKGEFVEVIPGIKYRVTTKKERSRRGFFFFKEKLEKLTLEAELHISSNHPKTKVWLMEIPIKCFLVSFGISKQLDFRTLYRRGLWRKMDLNCLRRTFPRLFPSGEIPFLSF